MWMIQELIADGGKFKIGRNVIFKRVIHTIVQII